MNTRTLNTSVLELTRCLFDLAEADVRPTVDLLGRLTGRDREALNADIAHLRRRGFIQLESLALTFAGLMLALHQPAFEPSPSGATSPSRIAAA